MTDGEEFKGKIVKENMQKWQFILINNSILLLVLMCVCGCMHTFIYLLTYCIYLFNLLAGNMTSREKDRNRKFSSRQKTVIREEIENAMNRSL